MRTKIKKIFKYFLVLGLAFPFSALAQSNPIIGGLVDSKIPQIFGCGGISCSQNLSDLIVGIIQLLLLFSGGIAVLFVIIGGYQYIVSGGNQEMADKGKKTVTNAVIGIILILLSYVIINVIVTAVS